MFDFYLINTGTVDLILLEKEMRSTLRLPPLRKVGKIFCI